MGRKAKLKKIRKMAYKKREKEDLETTISEESEVSQGKEERDILNYSLKPPFQVILDTNFINDCIRKKIDMENCLTECLDAEVHLYVPECVYAELEKLGRVFRLALNMIRKMKITKLTCLHQGNYADNCILQRVNEFKCYIVATSDVNLRQRIKKVGHIPIVFFRGHKCVTEEFYRG